MRTAQRDPALFARVVARRELFYDAGPDAALERPAQVRAGSGLCWAGTRLAIVQDDALWLALVTLEGGVECVALPAGRGGARTFDERRGNKADKPDFESAFVRDGVLYALGSGSTSRREQVLVVRDVAGAQPAARVMDAGKLYRELHANRDFCGSELNVEGACVVGEQLVLLQRGNGAERAGVAPRNARGAIDLEAFIHFVDADGRCDAPPLASVTGYDLGTLGGVRLTFTDASAFDGRIAFVAAAETSPDTYHDGEVVGVAFGVIEPSGAARWAPITDAGSDAVLGKAEGLAFDPTDRRRAYVVVDRDDPDAPCELCTLALSGL